MKDVNLLTSNGVDVKGSLELFGDMEMYDTTLEDFLKEVNEKLSKIKAYKESADMTNYAILVHSLKSDSKYLGFTKLAELSYNHEMKSKAKEVFYIYDHYQELMDEARRIIDLAQRYLGKEIVSKEELKVEVPVGTRDKALLVVDDSNMINNFINKIFKEEFEVLQADDGAKAIDLVTNSGKNIVGMLLDLNMPNVDGFQVLNYFKEHNLFVKIPVSIITGNDSRDMVQKAFEYPIVDLISKPFNERDIKRIVETTISQKIES